MHSLFFPRSLASRCSNLPLPAFPPHDEPRPLAPRRVVVVLDGDTAERLPSADEEGDRRISRKEIAAFAVGESNGDNQNLDVDAASALLPRTSCEQRRQRLRSISFLYRTIGRRLGPETGLVPALLDRRHWSFRRRRRQSRRWSVARFGRRRGGLGLVVGFLDRVPCRLSGLRQGNQARWRVRQEHRKR